MNTGGDIEDFVIFSKNPTNEKIPKPPRFSGNLDFYQNIQTTITFFLLGAH